MNEKNNMDILREIREKRNEELTNINDRSTFVIKIEDLGKGNNSGKEIYRLIEEKYVTNNGTTQKFLQELFYQYDNGPVLVGVRNQQTQGEIVPVGLDENKQKEWNIEKEEIEQCIEEREKQVKAIAKMLGIDEDEIESLSEIELSQKIDEKQLNGKEEKEDDKNQPKKINKEEMKKVGMSGMNEVSLQTSVDTKGTSLGNVLDLNGYSKIMVVHSYKLAELTDADGKKGNVNHMRFGLIAQKSDGTFETIPENKLRVYRGANNEITQIDNKDKVETKKEDCIFEVPGSNKRLVIDQKDPFGIPDVYFDQNTRDNDGSIAQKLQDKYDGTQRQDVEVRALFNNNRGINQAEKSVEEVREHKEKGCKDIDVKEADGDKNTGHLHYDPNSTEQQNAINQIMKQGNVSEKAAEIKLKHVLDEAENNDKDINLEQAVDEAVQEIEDEYRGISSRNK